MRDMGAVDRPLSVSALSQRIAAALGDLGPVLVQGELSLAKVHTSGHFYATLKDGESLISVVMWRSTVVRNGPLPTEGQLVVVKGTVTTYAPRGQYQLTATRITAVGAGDLAARFEQLKARLLAEGLFAEERKRQLPLLPRAVGLATAPNSAALADLLHSLRERFPRMRVVHAHCQVQGAGAAASIVAALRRLDAHPEVEVIICGRGGGSLEDLWAFNEEAVVRAIASCSTPVISAVGHETDTTLADFAADVRAKTPTAAAEMAVPVEAEMRQQLADWAARADQAIDGLLEDARNQMAAYAAHRALTGPGYQIELRRQRLDELAGQLDDAVNRWHEAARGRLRMTEASLRALHPGRLFAAWRERLEIDSKRLNRAGAVMQQRAENHLSSMAGRLDALSPLAVIARGYAVVRDDHGRVVRHLADTRPGAHIVARVIDGWIAATVDGHKPQKLNEPSDVYDVGKESP